MRSSILNQRSGVIIIIMIVIVIIIIIIIITIFGFFASLVREGKKERLIHSFNKRSTAPNLHNVTSV